MVNINSESNFVHSNQGLTVNKVLKQIIVNRSSWKVKAFCCVWACLTERISRKCEKIDAFLYINGICRVNLSDLRIETGEQGQINESCSRDNVKMVNTSKVVKGCSPK